MGPTPQWCEMPPFDANRAANGGFFTDFEAPSLKRGDLESRPKGAIVSCSNCVAQWCAPHPGTSRREPGLGRVDYFHAFAEPDARRRRHGRGRIVTVNCTERRQGYSKVCDTEVVTT